MADYAGRVGAPLEARRKARIAPVANRAKVATTTATTESAPVDAIPEEAAAIDAE